MAKAGSAGTRQANDRQAVVRGAYTSSAGIAQDPKIPLLLGMDVHKGLRGASKFDVIIGWGAKKNTKSAKDYAKRIGVNYWRLEDGFLGYLSHPSKDMRRLSIVLDRHGIYYDCHEPSELENYLNNLDWLTDDLRSRAEALITCLRHWRVSKYNQSAYELPKRLKPLLQGPKSKVLLIDQTYGDMSIALGGASTKSFADMLDEALLDHPDADIFIKTHPDVLIGKKRGHFDVRILPERVDLIADDCNPQALLKAVDYVYVVTSQMGLEALIAGKPVTCFGMPFYAGWGLTNDKITSDRRRGQLDLAAVIAAAYIKYSRYVDPFTLQRCEVEDVIDHLIAERQTTRPCASRAVAVGFSLWKRGFISRFIGSNVGRVKYIKAVDLSNFDFKQGDCVILWGRSLEKETKVIPQDVPIWRMEDGFLRSVGLGSDLRRPSSLVLDQAGIYYDGSEPSDLEHLLATLALDERCLERGSRLTQQILSTRVSKYNVGIQEKLDFKVRAGEREIILVPGQVESDASIQYGSPNIKTNAELCLAVRAAHPKAYIIFKPHPDVVSGNRQGSVSHDILDQVVDDVIIDADIIDCLDAVDSVHTMTSLTGFEALMRSVKVTTYGIPFYAGWGLTTDRVAVPRRTRSLKLSELVYVTLCVYPTYVDWASGLSTSPEALIREISKMEKATAVSGSGIIATVKKWGRKASYLAAALLK